MSLVLAVVAPGQGAQTPGFLAPWLDDPTSAELLGLLSEHAGTDLVAHGTTSDAETIRDTAVAQPLLVAAGLTAAFALFPTGTLPDVVQVTAGHSVGEITAAVIAGVMGAPEGMEFVSLRGRAMAEAAAARATSMTAIIGGDRDEVLAAIDQVGATPANHNGSGQLVAAGTVEQLQHLTEVAPRRTRLVPLSVAGAFHTIHMSPAVESLDSLASRLSPAAPGIRLLSNADGRVVTDGQEYLQRLVRQVANPVRWDLCMQTMAELGVTGMLELTPAGTLTGIAKRNLRGVELFNLDSPEQLEAARAFAADHRGTPASAQ